MKRNLFLLAALFTISFSYAQFYTGFNTGYSFGATPRVNGTEVKLNGSSLETSNIYGSYGAGINATLKFGYFFNKNLGAELNLGYLHGAEQTKADVNVAPYGLKTDATAASRLFRTTLSLVYRLDSGFYGRFGFYVPLGGRTEVSVDDTRVVQDAIPIYNPETGEFVTMADAHIATSYEQDIHGTPTIGFTGAAGYNFPLSENFTLFAEVEYLGLAIKSNDAEYTKYDQTVALPAEFGGVVVQHTTLSDLGAGKDIEYVDSIKTPGDNWVDGDDYDNTKKGVDFKQSAPYDSFGFNIGIKYSFGLSDSSK